VIDRKHPKNPGTAKVFAAARAVYAGMTAAAVPVNAGPDRIGAFRMTGGRLNAGAGRPTAA
jgi:hypothetical protein